MEERRVLSHDERLDKIAANERAALWRLLGLRRPLAQGKVWGWVVAQAEAHPEAEGDRFTLHLPSDLKGRPDREEHPVVRLDGSEPYVDAWAGQYLTSRPAAAWASGRGLPSGRIEREGTWPLALVALEAEHVCKVTLCDPAEATMFLLADVRPPERGPRARIDLAGNYLVLRHPDPFVTSRQLGSDYAALRTQLFPRQRPKRPMKHTGELIEFAEQRRSQGPPVPWREIAEEWNATHPAKHHYLDGYSMQRAYAQARKVREQYGMRPARTSGEEGSQE